MTKSPKFAFIRARWHAEIVDKALEGFNQRLTELGVDAEVETFDVPGAFEMPLLAKKLGGTGVYDGIAAAAFVVDGGIYRHDFVAQAVVDGLMRAGLDSGVPVLSVSLGDDGMFRIGNEERGGKTESVWLESGDVGVLGGPARLVYHGVDRIKFGAGTLLPKGGRINLTLRVVD